MGWRPGPGCEHRVVTAAGGWPVRDDPRGCVSAEPPGPVGLVGPGTSWTAGAGSVKRGPGGIAAGQVLYQRREVASQPVRLAPRPLFLAGRDELLTSLHTRLSSGGASPRAVALYGLAGAGKTRWRWSTRTGTSRGRAGLAVPGRGPDVLVAEFAGLAAQLGAREVVDARGSGGVGARGAGRVPDGLAAGVRQCCRPGDSAGGLAARRAGPGADPQPELGVGAGPGDGGPGAGHWSGGVSDEPDR